jgi:hypothetical protein
MGGSGVSMAEVVAAIEAAAPKIAGKITFEPTQLPNPAAVDSRALDAAIGATHWVPLVEGVQQTVEHFRAAAAAGRIDVERAIA